MDQYCDSREKVCFPLDAGWCRTNAACPATEPVCAASSDAVHGRCLQCLVDDHCIVDSSGAIGKCVSPGICETGSPRPPDGCPTGQVLGASGCQCIDGTSPSSDGQCSGGSSSGGDNTGGDNTGGDHTGSSNCPPNSTEVQPNQCVCNDGYRYDSATQGCVPGTAGGGGNNGGGNNGGGGNPGGGNPFDLCALFGLYGDGQCDACPSPDPDCAVPSTWTCDAGYYAEFSDPLLSILFPPQCDCGCGAIDPDCASASASACDSVACGSGLVVNPNNNSQCISPASGPTSGGSGSGGGGGGGSSAWTCPTGLIGDGQCDCGCGAPDPDCPANATASDCEFNTCVGPNKGPLSQSDVTKCLPVTWTCQNWWYADGSDCDCGCGAPDADCPNTAFSSCEYSGCGASNDLSQINPNDTTQCLN